MTDRTVSILPPNTTALDRALEQVCAPKLSPAVLRTLHDPDKIPAALLPWLGWGEDVPVWPADEAQQRDIIRRSHRLHGLIGTIKGLQEAARLTDAAVTGMVTTPAKTFLGGWSEKARLDWLASHPQLRLYPYRQRTRAQALMLNDGFTGQWPARSDAAYRATTRAIIHHPSGEVSELSTREWETGTEVGNATLELARHDEAPGLHCGQPLSGHVMRYTAQHRLWRLDQQSYQYGTATLHVRTTTPSLKPLSPDVDIVGERAPRPGATLLGAPLGDTHLCNLDSETRYYRRTYLHDPAIAAPANASPGHLGVTRLGMPPFHALAQVRMPTRRSHSLHITAGHLGADAPQDRASRANMEPTLGALDWMRAEADKILINTRHSINLRARQTVIAGTATAGQILER